MHKKAPIALCAVLTFWACSRIAETERTTPQPQPAQATLEESRELLAAPPLPLSSGLYFRSGFYERRACPDCVEPRWAALAGVFESAADATRTVRSLSAALPLGYPWAVHTDDLALVDASTSGIAVVTGLFASQAEVTAYIDAHGADFPSWQAAELTNRPEALERLHRRLADPDFRETEPHIIQVDNAPSGQVEAFAQADLESVYRQLRNGTWDAFEDYERHRDELTSSLNALCMVPSGTVHLTRGYEHVVLFDRDWLPVECSDGAIAYVPATATRAESVVSPTDGGHRIVQVVLVECDVPTFEQWGYGATGRVALGPQDERLALNASGCGGP